MASHLNERKVKISNGWGASLFEDVFKPLIRKRFEPMSHEIVVCQCQVQRSILEDTVKGPASFY